ncbi:MAG: hypothetical protein J6P41_04960 [Prevotella sp.]|nr:hypothetical protein [Prevotella sp.]
MRTHSVETSKDCNDHNTTRGITLQMTYNLNTTRSKYKGTGAGNAERNACNPLSHAEIRPLSYFSSSKTV